MGGQSPARRIGAAVVCNLLLGARLAVAEPASGVGLFPAQSTVILLAGVPGDVESEENYRNQLQGWLELAVASGRVTKVIVLCDNPEAMTPPGRPEVAIPAKEGDSIATNQSSVAGQPSTVSVLKGDRGNFLALGQTLARSTNALVVVAWGHGGKQGPTPVFHVRGPRITTADLKAVAGQVGKESRWILMFRGSGAFANELAAEARQIIASEDETMFSDDPVGLPLLLKIAKQRPELGFRELANELGRETEAWYKERNLARTEEPTLWSATDKPRHLVVVGAEEGSHESKKIGLPKPAATNYLGAEAAAPAPIPRDLPAVWDGIKRVEARQYPGADAVVLRRWLSYTLGSSPAVATEHEEFIQVLTPEGKQQGDFDVTFSPPFEDISFLDCEVLRPDGTLVRLDPDAIRDTHEQAVGDYQRPQRKFFSLPGVVPGAVLHVRYRSTWKTFPLPHVSLEIPIGQDLAIIEGTVQVSLPKDTPFHFALEQLVAPDPGIKQSTYGTSYTWRFENLPQQQREVLVSPGSRSRLLISTFPDWAAFEEWYGRISKLADEATPEIEAKARELTKEARDDREKLVALYNYVTRLRYVAVPMGINSFRPHAAANVLKNEFGDCKDKANLLNTLLRAVGIEAQLVLVPRFSQAHEGLPGLSFNHAISRVTLGGQTLWVDTTDDVCRFGMLPPGDPGRKVLVISSGTNTLTQLPVPETREHVLRLRGELDCSRVMDALPVKLEATAVGYPDYELRITAREAREHASTLPLLAAKLRPAAGSFALESQESTPVAALNEDFSWHASGTCVGLFAGAGESVVLLAPFWLPKEWDLALHRRKAAFYLNMGYPLTLEEEFKFTLPAEAQLRALPGVKENTKAPLRWRVEWTKLADGKLAARMRIELAQGELTEAETPLVQKQLRDLLAALAAGVDLTRAP
jgi:hypothetical protein